VTEQLSGKAALVTGGTGGIGKGIALLLAQRGVRLIIVGRDADKGARAERELRDLSDNKNVEFFQSDLTLVQEAHRLADKVTNRWPAVHYLVHSAGIVRGRRVVTAEGLESNFATNYLSRFALTVRLLPALRAAGRPNESARILAVAHPGFGGAIHYNDINLTKNFSMIRAFKQFHFANDLFAAELARRLTVTGQRPSITISCLHPGPTKTDIDREMPLWMKLIVRFVVHPLASRASELPAAAALKLLSADEFEGESGVLFSMVGQFKRLALPSAAQDPQEGKKLWDLSESLISSAVRTASLAPAAL
jgi:NAD(P)-dependent dehydrogenase (short-subunit alcohol dehydrogenase family)